MRTVDLHSNETFLGIKGDNKAVRVQMDVTDISEGITSGTYTVLFKRPDGSIYPVASSVSSKKVYVTLTATETLYPGRIFFEVQLHDLNDVLIKSKTFSGYIKDSLGEAGDPPNPPGREWVEYISGLVSNAATSVNGKHGVVVLDGRDINVDNSASPVRTIKDAISVIDTKADKTALTATDRRVDALYKLTQGQIWDAQEDTAEAYSKVVLSGSKAVALTKIGGKTIVWNRYCKAIACASEYGSVILSNNEYVYTPNTESTTGVYAGFSFANGHKLKSGHKYLYSARIKTESGTSFRSMFFNGSGYSSVTTVATGGYDEITYISTALADNNDYSQSIRFENPANGKVCYATDILAVDLTQMYGVGHEPESADDQLIEFIKSYAAEHPENNTGELVSAKVNEAKSEGKNLIDDSHKYTNEDGVIYVNANADEQMFFLPAGTYTFSILAADGRSTNLYVDNENEAGGIVYAYGVTHLTFTLDTGRRIALHVYEPRYTSVDDLVHAQLERGSTATTYVQHRAPQSINLPAAVLALDGYGWSAGTAHNSIEYDEDSGKWYFIKRVGAVDVSDWTWSIGVQYEHNRFFSNHLITDADSSNYVDLTNNGFLISKFTPSIAAVGLNDVDGAAAIYAGGRLYIRNDKCSTTDEMRSYMNGVVVQYRLANPVRTDITNLMTGTDNFLQTETGGTLTFRQQNDTTIAVPNAETYFVQLSEV